MGPSNNSCFSINYSHFLLNHDYIWLWDDYGRKSNDPCPQYGEWGGSMQILQHHSHLSKPPPAQLHRSRRCWSRPRAFLSPPPCSLAKTKVEGGSLLYCWWKKSGTRWYGKNLSFWNKGFYYYIYNYIYCMYILTGAGLLPSTICSN